MNELTVFYLLHVFFYIRPLGARVKWNSGIPNINAHRHRTRRMEIYRTAVAIFFGEIIDCRVTTQVNPRALGIRYQYQVLRKPSPRLGANLLDVAVQEGAGPIT